MLPRFFARLIDFIIIGIVSGIIGSLIGAVTGLGITSYGYGVGRSLAAASVSSLITAVIYLGYFTLMESRTGQTLGKMLLKLQTRGPDGGKPTTEQAFRRNAWTGLSVLGDPPGGRRDHRQHPPADRRDHDRGDDQPVAVPAGLARPVRRRHPGLQDRLSPVCGSPSQATAAGGPQEALQDRAGRAGAGLADVDEHGHREVAVHGDHPGVRLQRLPVAELGGAGLGEHRRPGQPGQERPAARG